MLRGQLVAANLVPRHPAEVDVPAVAATSPAGVRMTPVCVPMNRPSAAPKDPSARMPDVSRRPSENASQNTPRKPRTSSRPCIDPLGATRSASSLHGLASASRALNASTCRSTTRLGSATGHTPIGCGARILALCDGILTIGGESRHGLALSRGCERVGRCRRDSPFGRDAEVNDCLALAPSARTARRRPT
jgi:hypothetical protein